MRKIAQVMAVAVIVAILLAGCLGGDVSNVQRVVGESQIFNKGEINAAMSEVIRFFGREFDGCYLLELKYDEKCSVASSKEWVEQYGADEGIVLYATFYVGDTGGDGSLEPNSTYKNYQWVLTRSGVTGWKLQTWGYA